MSTKWGEPHLQGPFWGETKAFAAGRVDARLRMYSEQIPSAEPENQGQLISCQHRKRVTQPICRRMLGQMRWNTWASFLHGFSWKPHLYLCSHRPSRKRRPDCACCSVLPELRVKSPLENTQRWRNVHPWVSSLCLRDRGLGTVSLNAKVFSPRWIIPEIDFKKLDFISLALSAPLSLFTDPEGSRKPGLWSTTSNC